MTTTIAEATLDDKALGLVGVSKLAQDASSSSRILSRQSDSRVTLEAVGQSLVLGALDGQTQHGVLDDHVMDASLTQLLTQLGVVSHADAVVSNNNTGQRANDLLVQVLNKSLLGFQNLCTGHLKFTSFHLQIGFGKRLFM